MTPICNRSHYKTSVYRFFSQIYLLVFLLCLSSSNWLVAQATAHATQAQPETRLSPKKADELFRSLDDIMRFASDDTKLLIRHGGKLHLSNPDQWAQGVN